MLRMLLSWQRTFTRERIECARCPGNRRQHIPTDIAVERSNVRQRAPAVVMMMTYVWRHSDVTRVRFLHTQRTVAYQRYDTV